MTATLTQVVKQFPQDWTGQLESDVLLTACHGVAYRGRERRLDPVTTIQVFFVQLLHGNTALTPLRHLTTLNVTASAYCQARRWLPLMVVEPLLRSVSDAVPHASLDEGRWWGHRPLRYEYGDTGATDGKALRRILTRQLPPDSWCFISSAPLRNVSETSLRNARLPSLRQREPEAG